MENPKKPSIENTQDSVSEPELVFGAEKDSLTVNSNPVIGYDIESKSISKNEFVTDIFDALLSLEKGTLETYSSEEVKRKILE